MEIQLQIQRQRPQGAPYFQSYRLDANPGATLLDCLLQLKGEQDGSLTFRKNCRNTICGSCAMVINGRSALACKENVAGELRAFPAQTSEGLPLITVAPLKNLPVVKDLAVEMAPFWRDLEAVAPYLQTETPPQGEEFRQTPAQREQLNALGNCILCGACYSECNAKQVNPDFVGPHALAKAQRLLGDNRDRGDSERLAQYNSAVSGVWGCTRCYQCNDVCPMEVAPMDQIGKIKQQILAKESAASSRPVRHRKVLVDLVKAGGWVDERKFGVYVVGNYFRDLGGILSVLPLGLRLLVNGKFPLTFHPSQGTQTVKALIERVEAAISLNR
ncbi:MAG: succinate dehydrogenase/fumarate reductase iron-sulfur subunit [Cyanobacteriota bacterium]|jgi:succinate dehydrogenase / fumarate reductase iron-sulfur subunit